MAHDHRKLVLGLMSPTTGVRTGTYKTVKGKKLEAAFPASDAISWVCGTGVPAAESYALVLALIKESWLLVALQLPAKSADRILNEETLLCFGEAALALAAAEGQPTSPASSNQRKATLKSMMGKLNPTLSKQNSSMPPLPLPPQGSRSPPPGRRPASPGRASDVGSEPDSARRGADVDADQQTFTPDRLSPGRKAPPPPPAPPFTPISPRLSDAHHDVEVIEGPHSPVVGGNAPEPPAAAAAVAADAMAGVSLDFEIIKKSFMLELEILAQENRELRHKSSVLERRLAEANERYERDLTAPLMVDAVTSRERKIQELNMKLTEERALRTKLQARLDAAQLFEEVATSLQKEIDRMREVEAQRLRDYAPAKLIVHTIDEYDVEFDSDAADGGPLVTTTSITVMPSAADREAPLSPTFGHVERTHLTGHSVLMSADGKELHAASVEKLLEHLVEQTGTNDLNVFLMTYRAFLSPVALLKRLFLLYCKTTKRNHWLRIVSILSVWCKKFPLDWSDELVEQLHLFIDQFVSRTLQSDTLVDKMRRLVDPATLAAAAAATPSALVPDASPRPCDDLMELDVGTLAEQLILYESDLFRSITAEDCFTLSWTTRSSRLQKLTSRFNAISSWVAMRIMQDRDLDVRAQTIDYFVGVADECRRRNAFHTLMEITSALSCQPVFRLLRTWASISTGPLVDELRRMSSSEKNFNALRAAMRLADLPCLPYIGMFLSDLLFIEQGNPTTIQGLLNFHKLRRACSVIQHVQRYQSVPYAYSAIPAAQALLAQITLVPEDELFKRSWAVEAAQGQ